MKIFGKKRKPGSGPAAVSRQDAAADAIVLKLLADKPDPASRNAKERRLVKRYEERQQQQQVESKEDAASKSGAESETRETDDIVENAEKSESDDDDDDEQEEEEEEEEEAEDEEQADKEDDDDSEEKEVEEAHEQLNESIPTETPEPVSVEPTNDDDASPNTATLPDETLALLNQIPSKQRRKLVRQWERREATAQQVHEQANMIVNPKGTADNKHAADASTDQPKAKRRKKTIDESLLSPEERLRRQEQRRLQQEAKEKREKGLLVEDAKRHPLNSERRRANRRKPKWEKKPVVGGVSYKSEHASSGYNIRKTQKA